MKNKSLKRERYTVLRRLGSKAKKNKTGNRDGNGLKKANDVKTKKA